MALLWEGEIASPAEAGAPYSIWGEIYADASRTNNTVTVSNFYVRHRTTAAGANWHYKWETSGYINGSYVLESDTKPRTFGSIIGTTWYNSSSAALAVGVGTGGGSIGVSANWRSDGFGDSSGQQATSIGYPAASAPAGTSYNNGITTTTYSAYAGLSTWGDYASAGSVRSYIANNSGFTGQTYLAASNWGTVTHTGLTSNTRYWTRGWADNGAGLSAYFASVNNYTLPLAPVIGTIVPFYNKATVPTTINSGGGALTITKQYRFKLNSSGTWGSWTTYTGDDITITGLKANKLYDVQVQSTTTAGTTSSGTTTFETQPSPGKFLPVLMGL